MLLFALSLAQEDYSVHPIRRPRSALQQQQQQQQQQQGGEQAQPDWNAVAAALRKRADSVQSRIDAVRSRMVPVAEDEQHVEGDAVPRKAQVSAASEDATRPFYLQQLAAQSAWYAQPQPLQQPQQPFYYAQPQGFAQLQPQPLMYAPQPNVPQQLTPQGYAQPQVQMQPQRPPVQQPQRPPVQQPQQGYTPGLIAVAPTQQRTDE